MNCLRILRFVCSAALALVLLTLATVQFQQRLLRHRADQLMADMHEVHLYRSTWADAQKLISRWGAWGHYDGACTTAACRYEITLTDISNSKCRRLMQHGGFRVYSLFGGRASRLSVSFTVRDGMIWRETAAFTVTASPKLLSLADEFPLTLIVLTKSRQRLRSSEDDWWIMGGDDQLAEHPYYKAGRPGGCKINCEEAVVTYSTRTPSAEINRLTSFNFSCMTQFSSCMQLEQLLPAAKDWHLYQESDPATQWKTSQAKPCDIPLWVIARDTRHALIVEGISKGSVKVAGFSVVGPASGISIGPDRDREESRVKILFSLKGVSPWTRGAVVVAYPHAATTKAAEHLFPGKRYIVFPVGDDRRDEVLTKESPIELDRCGVWEDTPENRHEVEHGIEQNDELREAEFH